MNIELLNKSHDRSSFSCESPSLNHYLKTQATQDLKKSLTTCFVATSSSNKVIGYYTLAAESLDRDIIPPKYLKKLPPSYNAPVILLGRLARCSSVKGTGLGELLLIDALISSYINSKESIGAMAVVVDPINSKARDFYAQYGFTTLPSSGKVFLPMNIIASIL